MVTVTDWGVVPTDRYSPTNKTAFHLNIGSFSPESINPGLFWWDVLGLRLILSITFKSQMSIVSKIHPRKLAKLEIENEGFGRWFSFCKGVIFRLYLSFPGSHICKKSHWQTSDGQVLETFLEQAGLRSLNHHPCVFYVRLIHNCGMIQIPVILRYLLYERTTRICPSFFKEVSWILSKTFQDIHFNGLF